MEKNFDSVVYRRSRVAYMLQATFEYLISIMVTDAFLSKLLTSLGASDSVIGIVSSFISLAFLFQLLSIFLNKHIKNTKRMSLLFNTLSQCLFLLIYFIPFLPIGKTLKISAAVSMVLLAYASQYLISPVLFRWANSYVSPQKRGVFGALKEMLSLVCGMGFSLAIGAIIDRYEAGGNLMGGFLFIAIVMLVFNVCNFVSILLIKKEERTEIEENKSWNDIFQNTLKNAKFRNVVILTSVSDIAKYMTIGFMGTFKINDLMMSLSLVQIINIVANGIRMAVSIPIGRYSDKRNYAKGLELGYCLLALAFLSNIFCAQSSWWLVILFTVLYNASFAGTNANTFNIIYSCVPQDYFVPAMALRSSISGICGFLSSLVGSAILAYIQGNGNSLFGISVYGQQVLSLISFLLICVAICFDRLVVEKQQPKLEI